MLFQASFEDKLDVTAGSRQCPYPDCQNLVKLSEAERLAWKESVKVSPPLSRGVNCGKFHFFCWDCGAPESHAPLSCNYWQQWLTRYVFSVMGLNRPYRGLFTYDK
jgi:hypothetical protein